MTKEQLAREIAKGIIETGVEGGYDSISCSTAGDYPSIGVSQWEGGRADAILQAIGGAATAFIGMAYSDIEEQWRLEELQEILASEKGQQVQLDTLTEDCLAYVEALWEVPDLDDSRCTIYAGMWCPTSTIVVCKFLKNRAGRVNLRSLEEVRDVFRDEYAIAASVPINCYEGYANRAENTFQYVAAIDLTTPYGEVPLGGVTAKPQTRRYRKKPVVVEAYQTDVEMDIDTLEGVMHACVGDYIITGVCGEQYPCKPDIFEQTYELAE